MKNVSKNELKKCIYKEYDDFKAIIEEITNGLLTCDFDSDGLTTIASDEAEDTGKIWDGNILTALSKYFDAEVTSFHADDDEFVGIWICYK